MKCCLFYSRGKDVMPVLKEVTSVSLAAHEKDEEGFYRCY